MHDAYSVFQQLAAAVNLSKDVDLQIGHEMMPIAYWQARYLLGQYKSIAKHQGPDAGMRFLADYNAVTAALDAMDSRLGQMKHAGSLPDQRGVEEDNLNEFDPSGFNGAGGGGENERSRRIRKLLEIAIQVAKQKNVDELGMIHAMNMIAGDEFFNTAVEGILPDITDKEYMFVLQSAYKTVKQGMAEAAPDPKYLQRYGNELDQRFPDISNSVAHRGVTVPNSKEVAGQTAHPNKHHQSTPFHTNGAKLATVVRPGSPPPRVKRLDTPTTVPNFLKKPMDEANITALNPPQYSQNAHQRWPDDSTSLVNRSLEVPNYPEVRKGNEPRKLATKIQPTITPTRVHRLDRDTTVPNFLKKPMAREDARPGPLEQTAKHTQKKTVDQLAHLQALNGLEETVSAMRAANQRISENLSLMEAGSPAQQAAIAIAMKKAGKKPKHMSEQQVDEKWSQKYKSSINCSHPKGFSQRAHCAGKKKHNESIEMEMVCPDCGMCETHGDHSHDNLDEACWKGYHKEGMKKMFGKTYPNCVKNEGVLGSEDIDANVVIKKLQDMVTDQNDVIVNADYDNERQNATIVRDRALKALNMIKSGSADVGVAWKYFQTGEQGVAEGRLNEFAPGDGDDGEEETLHKYARMWYNGDDATQQKVEAILDRMGWEIGELESEEGGCFVVRAGDENGRSYIGFSPADLTEGVAEGSETSVDLLRKLDTMIKNFVQTRGQMGGQRLSAGMLPILNNLEQLGEKDIAHGIKNMVLDAQNKERATKGASWSVLAQGLSQKFPELIRNRMKQGVAEEKCPHCAGPMFSELMMNEKKDACYYKVKSRYKVWPSAYASGALVKCRKRGAANWGNKVTESLVQELEENLHDWFGKEKWVRMDTKGNIKGDCAREPGEGKPKCLPAAKAHALGKKGRASAAQRKRRQDPNPERHGAAINVATKKKNNEGVTEDFKPSMKMADYVAQADRLHDEMMRCQRANDQAGYERAKQQYLALERQARQGMVPETAGTTPATMPPSPAAAAQAKAIVQKAADDRAISLANIARVVPNNVAEDSGAWPFQELNELSNEKLAQYKSAAGRSATAADRAGNYELGNKRFRGITQATKKQFANDIAKHYDKAAQR
jgi:hypothetical protein